MERSKMPENPTSHYFHAEAHALTGKLKLPFAQDIKKQAFVKLEGQLADLSDEMRAQRNYFSQHSKNFRLEGIISYSSAHTQVAGHASDKHPGGSVTLSTSVVENLNVLNVVTADRVVAQISTTHIPDETAPHVTFLGTHFENLRIAQHRVLPYLKLDFAGGRAEGPKALPVDRDTDLMKAIAAQYERLKAALSGADREKMRLTEAASLPRTKYYGFDLQSTEIQKQRDKARENKDLKWEGITCSLVEHVEIEDIKANGTSESIAAPAESFGHMIHIPDFGNIFLAELSVNHNSYRLTMIRLDMGCLAAGTSSIASCTVNGKGGTSGGGGTL
jgi:hypothetical protein